MKIVFDDAQTKLDEVLQFLTKDIGSLRAGRASAQLVENIRAEVYGQLMTIKQVGNINVVDASLITIQVWDKSVIDQVRKAIATSELGVNPQVEGDLIKIPIPPLTEERRKEYIKVMRQKLEEARIAVRQVRKDVIMSIEADQKDNSLPEDEAKRREKELQTYVDKANEEVERIGKEKEQELLTV